MNAGLYTAINDWKKSDMNPLCPVPDDTSNVSQMIAAALWSWLLRTAAIVFYFIQVCINEK